MKNFSELTEREVLALAVSLEEEDERIFEDYVDALKGPYPGSAKVFSEMAAEEARHRHMLIELYRAKFGEHIPLIRRHDVRGFVRRRPVWLMKQLSLDAVREQVSLTELETQRFYRRAAQQCTDAAIRQLLDDLADAERHHEDMAEKLVEDMGPAERHEEDETSRRLFLLRVIQPGLAGLMDGSVSTLAPIFAAAFATQNSWSAFLVGLAAALGAGISMGFAEALSDNGSLTGRGAPWLRGLICGLMTAVGGLFHTLPFLIPDFHVATVAAGIVVVCELAVISWVRHRFMDTPIVSAAFQVGLGGALVFLTGIAIGSS